MRFVVAIAALALAACAPNLRDPAGPFREAVLRSERVGRAIYENDVATALATELLLDAGYLAREERIVGYVAQEGEGSLLVTYVAEEAGRRMVGHEVVFPGGLRGAPAIAPTPSDTPLVGERAVMYAARQTAIGDMVQTCQTGYNTVVLPASLIGEEGWLVYMLVASMNPGERVLAGHGLVRVSADGLSSLGSTPLSRSCLIVPVELPQGTSESGLSVTHLTTSWPLETHVYTSLLYGVPLLVRTNAGTWRIDGGRIDLINLASGG